MSTQPQSARSAYADLYRLAYLVSLAITIGLAIDMLGSLAFAAIAPVAIIFSLLLYAIETSKEQLYRLIFWSLLTCLAILGGATLFFNLHQ